MKLRTLKVEPFMATSEMDLAEDINTWLEGSAEADPGRGQAELVGMDYLIDGGVFYCFITYAEA